MKFSKKSKWNLKTHYQNCHKTIYDELLEPSAEQTTLTNNGGIMAVSRSGKISKQVTITNSIVKNLIAKCNFPLHIVENKDFRACINDIEPKYEPISYRTAVNHLSKMSDESTASMIRLIQENGVKYSIGIDLWSGRDKKEYTGCIVTFMEKWCLRTFTLFFTPICARPTAENVASGLRTEFDLLGLRYKLKKAF